MIQKAPFQLQGGLPKLWLLHLLILEVQSFRITEELLKKIRYSGPTLGQYTSIPGGWGGGGVVGEGSLELLKLPR